MSRHERRYQKYLDRQRQKKAHGATTPGEAGAMAPQIAGAANAPIYESLAPAKLFELGLGNLVFSRSLPDGRIALGVFLLDIFCLGVKNAFLAIVARDEYARRLRSWSTVESLQPMPPACFRKLVEGGVAYAHELGFDPHADYDEARQIFGDVRPLTARPISSTGVTASPSIFPVPMRPTLRCGASWTSSSGAWAQETLTSSCWQSNPANRSTG